MGYVIVHKYEEQDFSNLEKKQFADCAKCLMSEETNLLEGGKGLLCNAALYDVETLACFIPRSREDVPESDMVAESIKRRLFISQPMRGKTVEEILAARERAIESAKQKLGGEVEVIDSFFQGAVAETCALDLLGKSLSLLATADVAYFAKGWEQYRGCRIEHDCAVEYGIAVVEDNHD